MNKIPARSALRLLHVVISYCLIAKHRGISRRAETLRYFDQELHCFLWQPAAMSVAILAAQFGGVRSVRSRQDYRQVSAARPLAIGAAIEPHDLRRCSRRAEQIKRWEDRAHDTPSARYSFENDKGRLLRACSKLVAQRQLLGS